MSVENEIKKVAKYFQLPLGKLSYTDDNTIQLTVSGGNIVGYSTILSHLQTLLAKDNKATEESFLARQFFDYANVFIRSSSKREKLTACSELNSYLESRSYFIGQNISIADLVVFYSIAETMKQLPSADQFINLARWFDHLQLQEAVRQGTSPVNFSAVHLASSLRA